MLLPRVEPNTGKGDPDRMRRSIGPDPKMSKTTPCKVAGVRSQAGLRLDENGRTSRPGHFLLHVSTCDQVEYLNSGIAFSSSLVALKMAWSGHQGFGFEAADVVAAPVVVVEPAGLAGAVEAPV